VGGDTTTSIAPLSVVVSGFTGDGLAIPVAMGVVVFASIGSFVLAWRYRRA
jgi:hypothetical protein